ncbi:MAG: cysteine dioxygenase [Ilumatobacteraceae bacterium]
MDQTEIRRTDAIEAAMADIRTIDAAEHDAAGITRAGVEDIRDRLVELSAQADLFPAGEFPPPGPEAEESSYLYRLSQDDDDRFALYAQSSRGHVETPAHNHTTWAVVVGHAGHELNRFYERTDEGVAETHRHLVEAGTGVAMLPDDLHSIHIDGPALNFHCYGLALEQLHDREYFHTVERRWKTFRPVSGIREARHELLC